MILTPEQFKHLNGFYAQVGASQILFDLYKGVCQGCGKPIGEKVHHMGHIIPRNHAEEFTKRFPGLDIDNLLNLHLLHGACNQRVRDFFFASEFQLNQSYAISARVILKRLPALIKSSANPSNTIPNAQHLLSSLSAPDQPWHVRWVREQLASLLGLHKDLQNRPEVGGFVELDDTKFVFGQGGITRVFEHMKYAALTSSRRNVTPIVSTLKKTSSKGWVLVGPACPGFCPKSADSLCQKYAQNRKIFNLVNQRQALKALENCMAIVLKVSQETTGIAIRVEHEDGVETVPDFPNSQNKRRRVTP